MAKLTWLRRLFTAAPILGLLVVLLMLLYLVAEAEGISSRYTHYYPYVFVVAGGGVFLLGLTIIHRIWRLVRSLKRGEMGAKLTRRLLLVMVLLVLPPVVIVYGFSLRFISASIDSWLTANPETALESARQLSALSLERERNQATQKAEAMRQKLNETTVGAYTTVLNQAMDDDFTQGALQYAVFNKQGRAVAVAATRPKFAFADPPSESEQLVMESRDVLVSDTKFDQQPVLQVLLSFQAKDGVRTPPMLLRVWYSRSVQEALLNDKIAAHIQEVKRTRYLRDALTLSFGLILTFITLLSVLMAMLLAFDLARRTIAPIRNLANATRAIAQGDLAARVEESSDDELGFLAKQFNRMGEQLAETRAQLAASTADAIAQKDFLQSVLMNLSSGVWVLDAQQRIIHGNQASLFLLNAQEDDVAHHTLDDLQRQPQAVGALAKVVAKHVAQQSRNWREEIEIQHDGGARQWLVQGTKLPDDSAVVVFDDTSTIDQARRDAAWAEVAKRLAHEIKNPLTPIQLSAERLQRRVQPALADEKTQAILHKATQTIINQVDALKGMVDGFSDFSNNDVLQLKRHDLHALVHDVLALYQGNERLTVETDFQGTNMLTFDAVKIRQLLHNLIKNAVEASAGKDSVRLHVRTQNTSWHQRPVVALSVADDGQGLPEGFDAAWFDPYQSTKTKGRGLGLAIARKIAEQHGGSLEARQAKEDEALSGAVFTLLLPLAQ